MSDEGWWSAAWPSTAVDPRAVWARTADGARSVTFGELRARTAGLARTFEAHGIGPGATVALHGSPGFTHVWSVFALWSVGAQVVLVEPALSRIEREALWDLARPRFVVTLGARYGDEERFVAECEVLVRRRPGGRRAVTDHALVQFSSGTTGRPRPVGRTPAALVTEVRRLGAVASMPGAGERVAVLEPVARSFALIGGVLHAGAVGATVVLPRSGAPADVVEAAAAAEVVLGRPGHFDVLAGAPAGVRLPRLRLAVSGGDRLSPDTAGAFARRFGVLVGQAYGTTETGIVATDLTGGHGPDALGVPVPGVRTRVVGGALQVFGAAEHPPCGDPPGTAEPGPVRPAGWLATHDLVTRDPVTGLLRLRGRASGLCVSGADLVDVEEVVRAHRHVRDAVVLGPDPVEAHVVGTAELRPAELSDWCRRYLGERGAPRRIHVVSELARVAGGKALRDRARLQGRGWAPRPGPSAAGRVR
ncbi:class I adenylate-forming enzyme family protein (plasmid) [Streptomyces sp. BI20]|uniref:class I adenylate-forming enzyme family protein n=1 Tax=Streptomyces sp. BI20 TaxID=3403460 RepID=UPI003C744B48